MEQVLKYGCVVVALIIGVLHFKFALKAMFVFRNHEPISMWVLVFAGPLSTLPALILALFKPREGGVWLICGAIISFIAMVVNKNTVQDYGNILGFIVKYTIPMLLIGSILFSQKYFKN